MQGLYLFGMGASGLAIAAAWYYASALTVRSFRRLGLTPANVVVTGYLIWLAYRFVSGL